MLGEDDTIQDLTTDNWAFPWINFGNAVTINTEEDNSVTTKMFKANPRMIGKMVSNSITYKDRFEGMERFEYWTWQFENNPIGVMVFKATASDPWGGNTPTVGMVYEDTAGTPNEFTYLRTEQVKYDDGVVSNLYVFRNDSDVAAPQDTPAGTLTRQGGTETFVYTEHSGKKYEHLYELDGSGRRLRPYNTAEQAITGWEADDVKNPFCTLAKRMTQYDILYKTALATGFTWTCSSPGLAEIEVPYVAYEEKRGDYSSESWTLIDELTDNFNVPAHYQCRFKIGVDPDNLVELGMSEMSLAVAIPMQIIQDTISGLYAATPFVEGKADIALTGTIARHDVQTYQEYRDNQTPLVAKIEMHRGYDMKEFLFKKLNIIGSGPNDDDVAAEPLEVGVGWVTDANDPWDDNELYAWTQVQESPVVCILRNDSNVNQMFLE